MVPMVLALVCLLVLAGCLHNQLPKEESVAGAQAVGALSALFPSLESGRKEQPPTSVIGGCHYVGKWSVSRVLSDCFGNPDDHFSTSIVTHAL